MKAYLIEFWIDRRIVFVSFAFTMYALLTIFTPYTPMTWVDMFGGVVFFFMAEYVAHRFVLHGLLKSLLPKAYEGHELHHIEPTDIRYLLTPLTYSVPLHIAFWITACLVFHSVHTGSAAMFGLSLYQLDYEWTHFVSHRPIMPRTRWGKWMKKYHLLHHYKNPHFWYGVTNPAIDMIVGTNANAKEIPTEGPKRYVETGVAVPLESPSETHMA